MSNFPLFFWLKVNTKCCEIGHYPHLFWSCHGGPLDLLLVGLHLLALLLGRLLLAQPAVPPTLRVIALFRLLACRRLRGTSDRSSRTKRYRDWLLFPIKVILTGVLERRSKKLVLCTIAGNWKECLNLTWNNNRSQLRHWEILEKNFQINIGNYLGLINRAPVACHWFELWPPLWHREGERLQALELLRQNKILVKPPKQWQNIQVVSQEKCHTSLLAIDRALETINLQNYGLLLRLMFIFMLKLKFGLYFEIQVWLGLFSDACL